MSSEYDFPTPERPNNAEGPSVEIFIWFLSRGFACFQFNRVLKGVIGAAEERKTETSTLMSIPYQQTHSFFNRLPDLFAICGDMAGEPVIITVHKMFAHT